MKNRATQFVRVAAAAAAFCASTASIFAQSCPLCVNNVAASKPEFIVGLQHGIMILLFPPLAICLSIGWMTYHRRNHYNDEPEDEL
jgi:hypothetical protein